MRLNCRSGTQFQWKRNNRNINDNIKYSNTTSKVLTLLNVDLNDDGKYRCDYLNERWQHVDFYLVVQGKPDIRFLKTHYEVGIGGSVNMECQIGTARPPVTEVWWTKRYPTEVRIQADNKKYEERYQSNYGTSLNLLNVNKTDGGEYRCYARNERGDMFAKTTVQIENPPQVNINENYYISRVGDNVTIGGKIRDAHSKYEIEWKKSSVSQNNLGRKTIGNISYPFLRIRNVQLNDAGNYTLLVRNQYGENQDFTILKVLSASITGNNHLIKKANESITLNCKVNGGQHIPFVSTSREKFEVNGGLDTVLPCSHDSNPSPTNVCWTKNGVKIPVLSSSNYNGSTIAVPELIIRGTTENDAGTYVCAVSNSIGTGYSTPIQLIITDVVDVIAVIMRAQTSNKMKFTDTALKGNADEYDLPNIQTDDDDAVRTTGSLGDRNEPKETRSFTVHEFLQLFNDKDKYTRHVQLEFKNLTESYNSNQGGCEYYNTTASIRKQNNSTTNNTYLNTILTIKEKCMPYMSAVPQSNSIGQFWEFVSKNGVEHIILLTKENQQVSEFYPISDKPIEMKYLRLELDLSEKKNKNLFLFHLQLTNKEKQSSTIVKIYKTTNWKEVDRHLPLEVLAQLLDVTRLSKSKSSLIMTK
ncbi:HMCN [Mytilus edulis]|uniref:HMCN n=1 Tax=Mytilus edulis TaxID=6550 RepID=A0A8S3UE18_MYTED|nr:HMCN [Mytilus edulis]